LRACENVSPAPAALLVKSLPLERWKDVEEQMFRAASDFVWVWQFGPARFRHGAVSFRARQRSASWCEL